MAESSAARPLVRTAWVLVAGFALVGACVALLQPPFHLPDERRHYLTAQLRDAQLFGAHQVCSYDVALERHFRLKIHFDPDRKVPPGTWAGIAGLTPQCESKLRYHVGNALTYPGVLLVRWLTPEPANGSQALLRFRLARIAQGLLILALLARAAWLAGTAGGPPPGLLLLLALPLSPLFAQQSFGVTPDVVVNGFALSLALWLAFGEHTTAADRAVCVALGLITALTKPVLTPVVPAAVALGLWLEARRATPGAGPATWAGFLRTVHRRRVFVAGLAIATVTGLAYAAANTGAAYGRRGPVDSSRQLAFVREHPGTAAGVIDRGIARVVEHPEGLVGPLGYLDTRMTAPTEAAFALLLALGAAVACLRLAQSRSAGLPGAGVSAGLAVLVAAALFASIWGIAFRMYLVSTDVGGRTLYGLQSRYLFPHLLLLLGAVIALLRARRVPTDLPRWAAVALPAACLLASVGLALGASLDIVHRYG